MTLSLPAVKFLSGGQKRLLRKIMSPFISNNLNALAILHRSDKWNVHWYTQHYQRHFWEMRKMKLNVLEIGVGGYDDPHMGGNSLYMWKYFFPNSQIFAIDLHEKKLPRESRVRIFQGSQVDRPFLEKLVREEMGGKLDIVIDDGSHLNEHVIETFKILFPLVSADGWYAVEDMQTSYWAEAGGDSADLKNPSTSMNFFKGLTDCLNHEEFEAAGYEPSYYDKNIVGVHFYHNMVFVRKGLNNEGTNRVVNGKCIFEKGPV